MIVACKVRRPFMMGNGAKYEPNEYYRAWLEENVGEQNKSWSWDLAEDNFELIEFCFADEQHATLFELRWSRI